MKVCDFMEPSANSKDNLIDMYNGARITFASDLVVTTNHQPKFVFEGTTILVLKNGKLYARFEGENDRLYRYVRQGKYLHCSYIYYPIIYHNQLNIGDTEVRHIKNLHVFEICLTNTPNNEGTICTIDPQHPAIKNIHWNENVDRVQSDAVEGFKVKEQIEDLEKQFIEFEKRIEKLLMRRGITNGNIIQPINRSKARIKNSI